MPADNERFGASGGVVSYDTEQVTSSFALVRAFPMPPPARQAATPLAAMRATVRLDSETRKRNRKII